MIETLNNNSLKMAVKIRQTRMINYCRYQYTLKSVINNYIIATNRLVIGRLSRNKIMENIRKLSLQ